MALTSRKALPEAVVVADLVLGPAREVPTIGGLVGPWLVGWGSDLFGLEAGFGVNIVLALLMAAAIGALNLRRAHAPEIA